MRKDNNGKRWKYSGKESWYSIFRSDKLKEQSTKRKRDYLLTNNPTECINIICEDVYTKNIA